MQASSGSLRLLAASVWTPTTEEEARRDLQSRLVAYSKLVFWTVVVELLLLNLMYLQYPLIKPKNADAISAAGGCGLAVVLALWRFVLVRRQLSVETLYRFDVLYAAGIGAFLAGGAFFAPELDAAAYAALVLAYGLIFTRALVVPSSATRTAVTTTITFVPLIAAAVGLTFTMKMFDDPTQLPRAAFVGGAFVFSVVAVLLSAAGSKIIYSLRRRVSEAMQLGSYTLDRKIGEGGMGVVYRAHHATLRRPTAVKLLLPDKIDPDTLARFEREVQLTSQLTHPNTVVVFDYGHSRGMFYYAMEYLPGIDLQRLVKRHGPQPSARVAHILTQVCGALQEAHDAGLLHRDIKPANIILCERGGMADVAKVVDFGLVKEIMKDNGSSMQMILGTPNYVAPEAVTDPELVGPAADIYALGAVGYYMVTGRRLFEGKTAVDICAKHVTVTPPAPSSVSPIAVDPKLEAVLLRCLAKKPSDRWPSASAVADALAAIPPSPEWDRLAAKEWWAGFTGPEEPSSAQDGSTTMSITDLDHRILRD
jgi:serine/threonine-protein kinase